MYEREPAYALKSAEAVAAWSAGVSRHAAQTAPLCPSNVPIQSPVSPFRNIGFPSAKTKLKIHESLSPANMWLERITFIICSSNPQKTFMKA